MAKKFSSHNSKKRKEQDHEILKCVKPVEKLMQKTCKKRAKLFFKSFLNFFF